MLGQTLRLGFLFGGSLLKVVDYQAMHMLDGQADESIKSDASLPNAPSSTSSDAWPLKSRSSSTLEYLLQAVLAVRVRLL